MSVDPSRMPVLIGVGQSIERTTVVDAVELATRAAEAAFEDAPSIAQRVQRVSMVGVSFSPAGLSPATAISKRLGIQPDACEVTTPGGNTPQWLLSRAAEDIAAGRLETTLIVGAEATRSTRVSDPGYEPISASASNRSGSQADADPVVGASVRGLLSKAEIDASLVRPADLYPVFESALAAREGATPAQWRERIARYMSRWSEVGAANPFAWFRSPRSAEEIGTVSGHNRLTAEPYTKLMNSFANVDQGCALVLTNLSQARALGLEEQAVYPWSGANANDVVPAARPDLGASPAIRAAASAAFEAAGVGVDEIDFFDLYSCFPVAVEIGAAEIGLSLEDPRSATLTGGMSFFGGPGNNYASHGIAAAALKLREQGRLAYISGNGGLLSKHSIGIYGSTPPPKGFVLADTGVAQAQIESEALEIVHAAQGPATVEGGTVVYDRTGDVVHAPVIARLEDGRRVVAIAPREILPKLAGVSLVGEKVTIGGASPPAYTIG